MGATIGVTRYTLGILALLSVVCIWVSSSFLMNNIFAGRNYNKPFFITYINTASFSFYLLGPLFKQWRRKWTLHKSASVAEEAVISSKSLSCSESYGSLDHLGVQDSLPTAIISTESTLEQGSGSVHPDEKPLTHREIAHLSFAFCILWFAANWATNASLAYTTVASSTILASMSGFFTLAIGAFFKTESFSAFKLIAVLMSVLGVAFVSESDRGSPSIDPTAPIAPLFGDFLALMSAFFYGCYTVMLKVRIQNESRVNMSLFFGFVGLFNLLLLWPLFGVLHWTGIEPFELPGDSRIVWMIGINAIVGTFVSDYLWLLSMLMTSPLVVTLGLSLTIPLALLGDVVGYGRVLGVGYWIGAGLVLTGFFGVNGVALSERDKDEQEDQKTSIDTSEGNAHGYGSVSPSATVIVADERDPLLRSTVSRS
ncbi:hypothetical protein BG011_006179 [Mortierella polycephala]|uniref:EamA domain-containing protein n=1 Tax=Mortierella polycephala TaxID=41804 RepID=A0A9P6U856_9FUNG|nr:hypothetical protein BG011_006179 [Mortierella polycephala]